MSILDKILGYKKEEVVAAKSKANTAELEARAKDVEAPRGFQWDGQFLGTASLQADESQRGRLRI